MDSNLVKVFIFACRIGNEDAARSFIEENQEIVNARDQYGFTPLASAALAGHLAIVELLIASGALIDMPENWKKCTPLMWAASEGHLEVVEFLLSKGADVNTVNSENMGALYLAVEQGHFDIIEKLIEAEAKIRERELACAANAKHIEILKTLIAADKKFNGSWRAFMVFNWAIVEKHDDIIETLLSAGVNPTEFLLLAAKKNQVNALQNLLNFKVPVDGRDDFSNTALIKAAKKGHIKIIDVLIKAGAKIDAINRYGSTALILAIKYNREEAISHLIQSGADLAFSLKKAFFQRDTFVITSLVLFGADISFLIYSAIKNENIDLINEFIYHNIDLDQPILNDVKPLMLAIQSKNPKLIKLIAIAAPLTAPIALFEAIKKENVPAIFVLSEGRGDLKALLEFAIKLELVSLLYSLIARGVDMNQLLNDYHTPLILAVEKNRKAELINTLISAGARVDGLSGLYSLTPLIVSIVNNNEIAFNALIVAGADPNIKGFGARTALSYVIRQKNTSMLKSLINAKADVNEKDDFGRSPLQLAISHTADVIQFEMVDALLKAGAQLHSETELRLFLAPNSKVQKNQEVAFLLLNAMSKMGVTVQATRTRALTKVITEYERLCKNVKDQMLDLFEVLNLCFDEATDSSSDKKIKEDSLGIQIASMLPTPKWYSKEVYAAQIKESLLEVRAKKPQCLPEPTVQPVAFLSSKTNKQIRRQDQNQDTNQGTRKRTRPGV